jgi:hypothetical protein
MFLGVYRFDGQADALLAAYDRLMASMPSDNLELHVCTQTAESIAVFDACPTKEAFEAFAGSDTLRDGFAAAGLPKPEVEHIGEVHSVFWTGQRLR